MYLGFRGRFLFLIVWKMKKTVNVASNRSSKKSGTDHFLIAKQNLENVRIGQKNRCINTIAICKMTLSLLINSFTEL